MRGFPRQDADELREIAEMVRGGQTAYTKDLLDKVLPSMHRVVCQVLGYQHPEVEDVLQEASISFIEALGSFREECGVRHFACRVSLLTALNTRRRIRLRERVVPISRAEELEFTGGSDPGDSVFAERRRRTVLRLLDELPAPQAEAIAMHCVLGYTIAETAKAVGVSRYTIKSRLQAGKAAFRNVVSANQELEEQLRDWSRGTG